MTTDLAKGANAIASVFAVLDRVTTIEADESDVHCPERIVGDIEIHGVDFAYPARPDVVILRAFSLGIEAAFRRVQDDVRVRPLEHRHSLITMYVPSFLPPPSHGRELEEKDWRRLEKEKSDELNPSSSCCLNFDVYPANADLNV
ncbi:hypothetical protein ZIOFF_068642 [Zingiber officinale]|uniref:Uncharacterized protein n=1 Tax=Zingiber officinale TaxID=94328 RepID=A0A8J5CHL2_ZINOF|nr:hypothetical protein ZIOFF_068642 [Zingiber officinale]